MTYKITDEQLQQLLKYLEETPWKYAMPVMELLRVVVEMNKIEAKPDDQK
jgi:hypothetical protein